MKVSELLRQVRRLGRRRGIPVEILAERGKGIQAILKQLGLTLQDLQP